MEQPVCGYCGGRLRFDCELRRHVCARCGRPGEPAGAEPAVVAGVEVVDWLGGRPVSRYYVAVEATPPRTPSSVYLRALRRSYRRQQPGGRRAER